jgi:ABC-type nitrate/sulfonate/bicarbonate transport system substrate-binding protein
MMKKIFIISTVVVVVFLLLILYFYEKNREIIIVYSNESIFLKIAEEKGFYKEVGLKVRLIESATPEDVLLKGIASMGVIPIYSTYKMNLEKPGYFKIIKFALLKEGNDLCSVFVLKNSSVSSIKELKGKRLGVPSSGEKTRIMWQKIIENILRSENIGQNEINIYLLKEDERFAGLINGTLDASILCGLKWQSEDLKILKSNIITTYFMNSTPFFAFVINEEYATRFSDDIKKLDKVLEKSVSYMKENQEEIINFISNRTNISKEIVQNLLLSYRYVEDFNVDIWMEYVKKIQS